MRRRSQQYLRATVRTVGRRIRKMLIERLGYLPGQVDAVGDVPGQTFRQSLVPSGEQIQYSRPGNRPVVASQCHLHSKGIANDVGGSIVGEAEALVFLRAFFIGDIHPLAGQFTLL